MDYNNDYENNTQYNEEEEGEKTSVWTFLIAIILAIAIFGFIYSQYGSIKPMKKDDGDAYLTSVREQMWKDFDPAGIKNSGYCVVSFEINEEGWINKRQFVKKSPVKALNSKVYNMLKSTTLVEKPPEIYRNVPIEIEFGCTATETEVDCYSKNVVKNKTEKK